MSMHALDVAVVLSQNIGPILDDRLKENSWNPEKESSLFIFVCVRLSFCPLTSYRAHFLT